MIQPLGFRLLVKPESIEDIDPAFAAAKRLNLEIAGGEKQREQRAVDKGTIIAIGDPSWKAYDDGTPWAKVGDVVGYSRHGGKVVKDPEDDEDYIILNDEDIICRYAVKESNE